MPIIRDVRVRRNRRSRALLTKWGLNHAEDMRRFKKAHSEIAEDAAKKAKDTSLSPQLRAEFRRQATEHGRVVRAIDSFLELRATRARMH
jgi:hypothetical protein